MEKQNKKQFIQAIFCAPTGAYEDKPYPSRLTDEVFQSLAEAGINRIFAFGYDSREETREKTFEFCEKYGMKYYPVPRVRGAYTRVIPGKNGEKPYLQMTEEERLVLDQQLLDEVETMSKYPAFGGIFFTDESGYLSQDGIARAKKVFDTKYSDYEFHVNFFNYCVDDSSFWGGFGKAAPEQLPFPLEGDLALSFNNRFNRYDLLVEKLLSGAPFEYLSQDIYPFENFWPTVPTSTHIGLFELNAYFNEKKKKYGNKFYNYMQIGDWVDYKTRRMTFAEMALQMHVTAAYGSEGFAHFPGCFPLDWAGIENRKVASEGGCALIDLYGRTTKFLNWLKELNKFFKEIEEDILSSKHLGVAAYGVYHNGFDIEEVEQLKDHEAMFKGQIPDTLRYDADIVVKSSNEVLVATFERGGKKRYYVVNLSTVYENEVDLQLPKKEYQMVTAETTVNECDKICLKLGAGSGVYIREK